MSSKPGFWRKCRFVLRCARFIAWAVVALVLLGCAWLNQVGLPGFLKTRLVAALQERGVQLEFTRIRWHLYHGILCDNVRVGEANDVSSPVLTAREVQLRVDYAALLHLRLQVDGLVLRQGSLKMPLAEGQSLALTNVQGELRILPDDTWSLDHLRADFVGATFTIGGAIAHAPECRNWKMFAAAKTPERGSVQAALQSFSDTIRGIHFDGKPQLSAWLNGDARDAHSFALIVMARAPGVQTPWFGVTNLEFAARVTVPTNAPVSNDPALGFWTNLEPFRLDWLARGANLKAAALAADTVEGSGYWNAPELALTKLSARLGGGPLEADAFLDVATRELHFTVHSGFDPHALAGLLSEPARKRLGEITWSRPPVGQVVGALVLPAWTNELARWHWGLGPDDCLLGELAFTNTTIAGLGSLDSARTHFSYSNLVWRLPDLELTQGRSELGLKGEASETTKQFHCVISGKLDTESLRPFLTSSNAVRGFERLRFGEPLVLALGLAGDLRDFSSLSATGHVMAANIAFNSAPGVKAAPADVVQTDFAYSNQVWRLPDLELTQGRTRLELSGEASEATKQFHCVIHAKLDAESVRPFLTSSNAIHGFGHLTFQEPVEFALDLAGNQEDFSTLSATGHVAVRDFAIRGQSVDSLTVASLSYSNLTAEFFHPRLVRAGGAEEFTAEKLTLDLAGQRLFLYGGEGQVTPMHVAKAIGPLTAEAMAPYQFLAVPHAKVDGCIPLKQRNGDLVTDDADLWFHVVGTVPFRWRKFETPRITGSIHWLSNYLILTNVVSECYGGSVQGWGAFDLATPGDGTDFAFFMEGTNVDFNAMGRALWSPTNQLRGDLSGRVMVTKANSSDWRTWNGYGQGRLQNGLLWNAPIFGLMSTALNKITPGLDIGNNRATEGDGRFKMTNGVIYTDSLKIRSLTTRFDYVGTVDLDENVSARVLVQPLRNTPVFGSVLSLIFLPVSKALECDVTGTLDQPKITPAYIPFSQVLTAPLHPIRSMEKIFSPPATNNGAKP